MKENKTVTTTLISSSCVLVIAAILALSNFAMAQSSASKEYQRLLNISKYLRKLSSVDERKEPYRSYLKRNAKDIVYGEPADEWLVRSKRYWDLATKYKYLPIADGIAWTAAENGLPGECEGYAPCNLSVLRMTYAEYLFRYPRGKHVPSALQNANRSLSYLAEDAVAEKKNYDFPGDEAGRAEFRKDLRDLRSIFVRISHPLATKAISQLKVIEDGFK